MGERVPKWAKGPTFFEKVPLGVSAMWDDVGIPKHKCQWARTECVKKMQNEKCKVKNTKFKEKNTFMAGEIRRSGEVVFGES